MLIWASLVSFPALGAVPNSQPFAKRWPHIPSYRARGRAAKLLGQLTDSAQTLHGGFERPGLRDGVFLLHYTRAGPTQK